MLTEFEDMVLNQTKNIKESIYEGNQSHMENGTIEIQETLLNITNSINAKQINKIIENITDSKDEISKVMKDLETIDEDLINFRN